MHFWQIHTCPFQPCFVFVISCDVYLYMHLPVYVYLCLHLYMCLYSHYIAVFAGVVAAAGLFGLDHVYPRLGEEHERCKFSSWR